MDVQKTMEDICLKQDNGCDFAFCGRLFSECSWYDEALGTLTRQKLYVTESNEQIYYIVRSSGQERSRHAYKLFMRGDVCDMLMLAVRGLCGLDSGATPSLSMVEEMLKAANA